MDEKDTNMGVDEFAKRTINELILEVKSEIDRLITNEFDKRKLDKTLDTIAYSANIYTYTMLFCSRLLRETYQDMIEFQKKEMRLDDLRRTIR